MKYFVFCLFMVFIAHSQANDSYEGCAYTADAAVGCLVKDNDWPAFQAEFAKCSLLEIDWENAKSSCLSEIYNNYMDNPEVVVYLGHEWCKYIKWECSDEEAKNLAGYVMFWIGAFNVLVNQFVEWGFDRCTSKIDFAHDFCYVEETDSFDDNCIRFYVGYECPDIFGEKRSMLRKSLIPNHGRLSMKKSLIPSLGLKAAKKSIIPQGKQPTLSSVLRSLRNRKRSFQPNFVSGNKLADQLQKAQK